MTDLEIIAIALCRIANQLQYANVFSAVTLSETQGKIFIHAGKELEDILLDYEKLKAQND